MNTEALLGIGLMGLSAPATARSVVMLRTPKDKRKSVEIDAAVRDASYHLLARREEEDGQ